MTALSQGQPLLPLADGNLLSSRMHDKQVFSDYTGVPFSADRDVPISADIYTKGLPWDEADVREHDRECRVSAEPDVRDRAKVDRLGTDAGPEAYWRPPTGESD